MLGKLVNNKKAVWYTLLSLAIAVLVATGFMLMGVFQSGEVSAQSGTSPVNIKTMEAEDIGVYADAVYTCKADDIEDTAVVAELLETMDLEGVIGEYTVQIASDDGVKVMTVTAADAVQKADKKAFDASMRKCAQQFFALIPQINKVQWTYVVISENTADETVTVALDEATASEKLGKDAESYGASKGAFEKLLKKQVGE